MPSHQLQSKCQSPSHSLWHLPQPVSSTLSQQCIPVCDLTCTLLMKGVRLTFQLELLGPWESYWFVCYCPHLLNRTNYTIHHQVKHKSTQHIVLLNKCFLQPFYYCYSYLPSSHPRLLFSFYAHDFLQLLTFVHNVLFTWIYLLQL